MLWTAVTDKISLLSGEKNFRQTDLAPGDSPFWQPALPIITGNRVLVPLLPPAATIMTYR